MKPACMVFVLAALLAAPAFAEPGVDTPPLPSAPREPKIAAPSEQRLDNGLRVVVAERHGVPLVSARLLVLAGAERDPAARAGLASMTAGLLTRGTKRHGAPALAAAAEALGGSLDAGAGWHESGVGITVTVPKLPPALALLSEVVREPTFAPAEIERYRDQSLDDMKLALAEPGTIAGVLVQRALYGGGAYGHPASGTPASLPRISRADLVALHATLYRPDNAVLVLAGDLTPQQGLALAKQAFGGWSRPARPLPEAPATRGQAWPEGTVVVDMPGAGQAGVAVALPIVPAASPERFVAEVANAVLGAGYSSRLNQEIRIKRGLSYSAASRLDLRAQAGALRVGVQTKNPSAAEVLQLVSGELDGLAAAPVPQPELDARRASLVGDFSRSLETTAGLAAQAGSLAVVGLPMSDLPERVDRLQAVTPQQVQAFAARHFGAAGRRAVIAGVAADFASALKGPVLKVPQAGIDLDAAAPPAAK